MAGGDDIDVSGSTTPAAASDGSAPRARSQSGGRSGSRRRPGSREAGTGKGTSTSRSRFRSGSAKRTTWTDRVKGTGSSSTPVGKKTTASQKADGKAQPEHACGSSCQALEAENQQLRRELNELREALNSVKAQITNREEVNIGEAGPLAGKVKRKAPNPEPISETEGDEEEEMADPYEAPTGADAPAANTKRTRGRLTARLDSFEKRIMELFSRIEERITHLERPKIQPRGRPLASAEQSQAIPNPGNGEKGEFSHPQ